jgi:hypothetical protein
MDEKIRTFLKCGELGDLALGLSPKEAKEIVGPPEKYERWASRRRRVWEMDDLVLSFFKGKLDIIRLDCKGDELKIPYPSLENKRTTAGYKTYDEFVSFLSENQIEYNSVPFESHANLTAIRLASGIRVYFESMKLYSIEMM